MSEPVFDFRLKHFGIRQASTAMKVGTDAIVLGAWVSSLGLRAERILDIGTGTGIVLLMLMQSLTPRLGVGVDISDCIEVDAEYNRLHSPWAENIELFRQDILAYRPDYTFDIVVSNPPYFDASGLSCQNTARELARREQIAGLTLDRLISQASSLLSPRGELFLITPWERENDLRRYATEALLRLSRRVVVYSTPTKPVRLLTAWTSIDAHYHRTIQSELCLRTGGGIVSDEYRLLTLPFLL